MNAAAFMPGDNPGFAGMAALAMADLRRAPTSE